MAQAKAREISIESARAKASAEKAFKAMVLENNKVCDQCKAGAKKIKTRRNEIDTMNKKASKAKQMRKAHKVVEEAKEAK